MQIMNDDGVITDKELNELATEVMTKFGKLLDSKPEWTQEQRIVAAFHVEGFVNTEIMRRTLGNVIKRQQGNGQGQPTLKPIPKD